MKLEDKIIEDKIIEDKIIEDKITTREEWLKMVPHESEAEVPPVPTFKEVLDYIYKYCLKK